jgi:hypothetical protein
MDNPFPGIDPYLEAQRPWQDFHTAFLTYTRDALNEQLPDRYDVEIQEQITLVSHPGDTVSRRYPDLMVVVDPLRAASWTPEAARGAGIALKPVTIPLDTTLIKEEVVRRWIEIRRQPDRSLVTVIELLSPSNKEAPGRSEYVEKRLELIDRPVHLVEIDFLIGGHRLPMGKPMPRGDYFALVARADQRPDCDVFAWSVHEPLPTIPIPLDPPDPDFPLDLAVLYATAYVKGRYARKIHRDRPLGLPLAPEDLAWASSVAGGPGS